MPEKHKCPSCKQDGGVLLFQHVTECDRCRLGRIVVTPFDRGDGVPRGCVGFIGYAYSDERDASIRAHAQRFANSGPESIVQKDANRVVISGYTINGPGSFTALDKRYKYFIAASLSVEPQEVLSRDPRVVGQIPEIWTGASGSQHWAEGHEVTMILSTRDVPLERTLHTWAAYPYASAPDCNFKNLDGVVQPLLRQPRKWEDKPAARKAIDADDLFKRDMVLLVVRR